MATEPTSARDANVTCLGELTRDAVSACGSEAARDMIFHRAAARTRTFTRQELVFENDAFAARSEWGTPWARPQAPSSRLAGSAGECLLLAWIWSGGKIMAHHALQPWVSAQSIHHERAYMDVQKPTAERLSHSHCLALSFLICLSISISRPSPLAATWAVAAWGRGPTGAEH